MIRIFTAIFSGIFFTLAIREASKSNYLRSKLYLDFSDYFKNIIYSHDLLRGHIMYALKDFSACRVSMDLAIDKINKNSKLNFDEKCYLKLYAADLINASIVHGEMDEPLRAIFLDFDIGKVEDRIRENFPIMRDL